MNSWHDFLPSNSVCNVILMINKLDSHFVVFQVCWSLVWLQTKLDSTQSYYHHQDETLQEWAIRIIIIKKPYPPSHFPCIPVQDTYAQTWDKVPWLTQAKKEIEKLKVILNSTLIL